MEDHAIGLVRYENGAIGQFEVSWVFRGGMDLRDEVVGTDGTLWLDHWLRTGSQLFLADRSSHYVAEKAEGTAGWQFPVGDEAMALGYPNMFADMLTAFEKGREPRETFYDGYVVNAIIDAAYKSVTSKRWEPIELLEWRGDSVADVAAVHEEYDEDHWLVKRERLPDGRWRTIVKHKQSGEMRAITTD